MGYTQHASRGKFKALTAFIGREREMPKKQFETIEDLKASI